jgi:hypothetical protein
MGLMAGRNELTLALMPGLVDMGVEKGFSHDIHIFRKKSAYRFISHLFLISDKTRSIAISLFSKTGK